MKTENYFKKLEEDVRKVYRVAEDARKKGLDPVGKVEIPLAMSMAEKVVGLISTIYSQVLNSGIVERILELEREFGKLDTTIVFKIAEEVARQNFCKFSSELEAIDAGIRVGFAYATLGVVSSPIEGFTGLKLGKTKEGESYFIASFSGPIRSAGTTASCIVLMLIDFLRESFGYAKYDPTENENKRIVTELFDFNERVANLQYMPTEDEILFLAKHMPIQVAGEPSEKIEVSNYKNLDRVDTDFLRSGFCLIMAEGLAQKSAKGFRLLEMVKKNGIKSTGFDWIKEYIELHEKITSEKNIENKKGVPTYIRDLVAGRPIYGHPSRSGGFRFRYGRGRVSGFSAVSVHPATMAVTDNFIATGTQLKLEKPTKGCVVTVCDSIEGPIVKMKNGDVCQLEKIEGVKEKYSEIEEIIYLGDILFPFSDVANRNATLVKPGYVEEWWNQELKKEGGFVNDCHNVKLKDAIELSKKYNIPLYPKFIFYWTEISDKQFLEFLEWLRVSKYKEKIEMPFDINNQENFKNGKRALELLGIEHKIVQDKVIIDLEKSEALMVNLGIDFNKIKQGESLKDFVDINKIDLEKGVLENVNKYSDFEIKNKAGDFIGSRMGRPEKAKIRKLQGSPNVLFPVGNEGGRLRSVQAACNVGKIKNSFPLNYCESCKIETIYSNCEKCGSRCRKKYYFNKTKEKFFESKRDGFEKEGVPYCYKNLDINYYFEKAYRKLKMEKQDVPLLIKGIRKTVSSERDLENLSKGILRAKYDLQVNKDGTIRFDATELPLVSFKPKEIEVNIEKLKELGYVVDIYGKELINENQIIELMPHDILLPSSSESPDERADNTFLKIANFVDEELVKLYGMNPFYKTKIRDDLIGQLGVFMAPHNCAGVVCRFIGFSNTLGVLASPYMHAAVRRDCDGDEAAIMLLGDVLINFSRKFLPSHRGGTQDAPLVLNAKIDAGEVDDQILDFECVNEYPLELYELSEKREHSSKVKINVVKNVLKNKENPFLNLGFTHDTTNFNEGVVCSNYKILPTMVDKVAHQMELVKKIRATDTSDTARLIVERHFLRDMKGNLRKFSMQGFRCVGCNNIVRRPPLSGQCPKCKGKLIFTIHEGGIKKYLESAIDLAKKYNLSGYLKQHLELIKMHIESIFGKEKKDSQTTLELNKEKEDN